MSERFPAIKHHRQVDKVRAQELSHDDGKRLIEKKTDKLPILVTKPIIAPSWLGKKYTVEQLYACKEFYSDTLSPLRGMRRRSLSSSRSKSPVPGSKQPGRFSPTPHGGIRDLTVSASIPKRYIYEYVYYCYQTGTPVPDWMKTVADKMGFKGYTVAWNAITNQRFNVL
jgi:hypothetical protein